MSLYLFLNIAVITVPLLFSFESKIKFYSKWRSILPSIFFIGVVYIGWDILSLRSRVWHFNENYTSDISVFGLPLEEVLFFITVPYACIFLYESLDFYLRRKINVEQFGGKQTVIPVIIVVSVIAAAIFSDQAYTFWALISLAVFFLISYFFHRELLRSKVYWIFAAVSFIPFLAVNYVLTSVPVVLYNDNAIWGVRFLTIPLEDFIYSFSMNFKRKLKVIDKQQ